MFDNAGARSEPKEAGLLGPARNRRILIADDIPSIHLDFQAVLGARNECGHLDALEGSLFGSGQGKQRPQFELTSAYQGQEAVQLADAALKAKCPFAVAFVDMRMPPGWDGLRTVEELWKVDPGVQVVICTAYADQPWEEVLQRLDVRGRLLVIKKPFESIEVIQAASTLAAKWAMERQAEFVIQGLEKRLAQGAALRAQEGSTTTNSAGHADA